MSSRTSAAASAKKKEKEKTDNPSDSKLSPAEKEFMLVIMEAIPAQQRFTEFQRLRDRITLGSRERLLLRVLWRRESRGIKGIPVTKLAAEYNSESLDQMKVGESTVSAMVTALEKQGYVKKVRSGRGVNVELADGGRKFIDQDDALIAERVKIYTQVCPEPHKQAIVKDFLRNVMAEFSKRIEAWRRET